MCSKSIVVLAVAYKWLDSIGQTNLMGLLDTHRNKDIGEYVTLVKNVLKPNEVHLVKRVLKMLGQIRASLESFQQERTILSATGHRFVNKVLTVLCKVWPDLRDTVERLVAEDPEKDLSGYVVATAKELAKSSEKEASCYRLTQLHFDVIIAMLLIDPFTSTCPDPSSCPFCGECRFSICDCYKQKEHGHDPTCTLVVFNDEEMVDNTKPWKTEP